MKNLKKENSVSSRIQVLREKYSEHHRVNVRPSTPYLSVTRVIADLCSGLGVGIFIGYMIDKYCKTTPVFIVIMSIFGSAGGLYNIYKDITKASNNPKLG
ncbi:putative ATP synthase protein I [Alphaproteobacteria bacterium]